MFRIPTFSDVIRVRSLRTPHKVLNTSLPYLKAFSTSDKFLCKNENTIRIKDHQVKIKILKKIDNGIKKATDKQFSTTTWR